MRLAFRTKLLLAFVLVVGITGIVGTLTGFSFISRVLIEEAMRRVEMDLSGAWAAFEEEKGRLQIVLGMVSQSESLRAAVRTGEDVERVREELATLRARYDLDFLNVVGADGRVLGAPSDQLGAHQEWQDPILEQALDGVANTGTVLMPREVLLAESEELATRAYTPLLPTEKAVPTTRTVEDRGMVVEAAFPVIGGGVRPLGAVYGGILLNGDLALVDRIRDTVFGDLTYEGERPVATVTFFLGDVRVATNVMLDPATRALGTRVSKEVNDQVLGRGERWADRAFVVNDWYLSAYDPIRDPAGNNIGIIYVGLLEKTYLEYRSNLAMKYVLISLLALLLSLGVALYLSEGFRRPIHRLVRATRSLSSGDLSARVEHRLASKELAELGHAFNSMAETLERRTQEVERTSASLTAAYQEARDKNRAYLETLGFVTHELKSPLASIVFGIGALREHITGPLNPSQEQILKAAAHSADYLRDTIANYLNLSRIEEGELKLTRESVAVYDDLVGPLLHRISELATERDMKVRCRVPESVTANCDRNLITSVLQNLFSNAAKYGRDGGEIRITASENEDGGLRFSIWNDGPGFDRDGGEKLFQKFSRLREGSETKAGTGLGLFVSRSIIEKHGGRIWARSEPGEWAEFIFELPPAEEPAPAAGA